MDERLRGLWVDRDDPASWSKANHIRLLFIRLVVEWSKQNQSQKLECIIRRVQQLRKQRVLIVDGAKYVWEFNGGIFENVNYNMTFNLEVNFTVNLSNTRWMFTADWRENNTKFYRHRMWMEFEIIKRRPSIVFIVNQRRSKGYINGNIEDINGRCTILPHERWILQICFIMTNITKCRMRTHQGV